MGKRCEDEPGLNKQHVLVSVGLTVVPLVLIILHQWSVGNIGPKSDSIVCGDYCRENGYSTSSVYQENSGETMCGCYDDSGEVVMQIPLLEIGSNE